MKIADADRVLVTTFAEESRTTTAEWVVELDTDRIGFWTPDVTEWPARLATSEVVSLQAADGLGRAILDEPVLEGRAYVLTEGADFDLLRERTRTKYRLSATVVGLVDAVKDLSGPKTPAGAVVLHIVA
ncbi:MAG: hypothetical protein ACK5LN_01720 [Propioniciclava sp.]